MTMLGRDIIIVSVADVRKLVNVLVINKSKDELERLQKQGILELLNELWQAVSHYENTEKMS